MAIFSHDSMSPWAYETMAHGEAMPIYAHTIDVQCAQEERRLEDIRASLQGLSTEEQEHLEYEEMERYKAEHRMSQLGHTAFQG